MSLSTALISVGLWGFDARIAMGLPGIFMTVSFILLWSHTLCSSATGTHTEKCTHKKTTERGWAPLDGLFMEPNASAPSTLQPTKMSEASKHL